MSRQFPLALSASPQVLPIPGGELGFHEIYLSFPVAPSAGTVTLEKREIGSALWLPINRAQGVDVTSGEVALFTDGPIGSLRVTFAGLVGGGAPALWLSSQRTAWAPLALITDGGTGPSARLRVDVAQTGFFAGREFRTFKEWATPTTATYVIRATVPINIILFELGIHLDAGTARIETVVGGTPGGTFLEVLPIFPTNTMSERPLPIYSGQVVLEAGGTLTGGTVLDVLRAKTSDNSNFSASVGEGTGAERGVAANTYYYRITLASATGVFAARWEERPNGSQQPFP